MNLLRDFANIIENLMIEEGIKYDKTNTKRNIVEHYLITRYIEVHERKIETNIKYSIKKTELFENSYNKLNNDEKEICDRIIESLTKGKNINDYLSSGVLKRKLDNLLSCWGINHLHLQEKNENNKYDFVKGSKLLLLARYNSEIVLVDIIGHPSDTGWFHKSWLEAIDAIEPHYLLSVPSAVDVEHEIVDDESIEDIEKKCNIFLKINNKVVMPNFGCATSGNSIKAVMKANRISNFLKQYERSILKNIDAYRAEVIKTTKKYNMRLGKNISSLKFGLILEGRELYLYETQYLIKFPFYNINDLLGFNACGFEK